MSPQNVEQLVFLILAAIVLGGGWGVARAKTVFVGALWLIFSFVGIAGLYVLLDAGFLAVIQILVYVGAISVLILFAIMLTDDVMEEAELSPGWALAIMVVGTLGGLMARAAFTTDWPVEASYVAPAEGAELAADVASQVPGALPQGDAAVLPGTVAALGRSLMTEHLLAFEVISIILLVALVGAIVIARD